jgi:hypothetical protein
MTSPLARPSRFACRWAGAAFAIIGALFAGSASADVVLDLDGGGLLPTYTGPANGDLDIQLALTGFDGETFTLGSISEADIGTTDGIAFVWGVNRGAGTARLAAGNPSLGASILFDAVIVLRPDATGSVTTFGPGGAVTTALEDGTVFSFASIFGAFVPLDLLPSTGFTAAQYTFNLWTRGGPGNAGIADFAQDHGNFGSGAVPEPATWALMISGFGLAGASLRRRKALAA